MKIRINARDNISLLCHASQFFPFRPQDQSGIVEALAIDNLGC
jgi:hypothetical protein